MSVTGEPDGNPVKCGIPVGDLSAGLFCAVGDPERAARARAHRRGPADRHVAVRGRARALDLGDGRAVGDRARAAAARLRAPADRAVPGAAHARRLHHGRRQQPEAVASGCARRSGAPELAEDPRFATNDDRMANRPDARRRARGGARRARRPTSGSTTLLEARRARAGRSTTTPQVFADPHTQAREMEVEMEHPEAGTVRALGIPVKLSATPGAIRRPAPLLGQHTDEILREAGLDADEPSVSSSAAAPAAWVTFNRPEAHNAMTFAMYERARRRAARPSTPTTRSACSSCAARARRRSWPAPTSASSRSSTSPAQDGARLRGDDRPHRRPARGRAQADRSRSSTASRWAPASRSPPPATCASARRRARFGLPIARTVGNCLSMGNYARLAALLGAGAPEGHRVHAPARSSADEALAIGFATEVVDDAEAHVEELASCSPPTRR